MIFRCKNKALSNYGHTYKVTINKKYMNGYEVDWGGTTMHVSLDDMEIIQISEEEREIPITFE